MNLLPVTYLSAATLGFTWALHSVSLRWVSQKELRQLMTIVVCLGGSGLGMVLLHYELPWGHAMLLALTLNHVYFHFFNMSETARRIKILIELEQRPGRRLKGPDSYDGKLMIQKRIERLRYLGIIEAEGNGYRLKKKAPAILAEAICRYEEGLYPERFTRVRF